MLIELPMPDAMRLALLNLSHFHKLHYTSCIAGGWPRDMLLGRQPKDVDVWEFGLTESIFCDIDLEKLVMRNDYTGSVSVFGVLRAKGHDTIFVGFRTIEEVLNDFDLSICQIAITNTGRLLCTESFQKTLETKVVTFGGERTSYRRHKRIERLKKKYPEYQWPDPTNLTTEMIDL